jgi:hypothetical protein
MAKWFGSEQYSTECICSDKNSDEWVGSNSYNNEYSSQELSDRAEAVTGECLVRKNRIGEWFERSLSSKKLLVTKAAVEQSALGSGIRTSDHDAPTTQKVSATEQKQPSASEAKLGSCVKNPNRLGRRINGG